jgi:hypothetical protein
MFGQDVLACLVKHVLTCLVYNMFGEHVRKSLANMLAHFENFFVKLWGILSHNAHEKVFEKGQLSLK